MGKKDKDRPLPPPPSGAAAPTEQFDMVFHCQLAHGSPTRQVRDFTNVKQLYESIAKAFGIATEDVSCFVHICWPKSARVPDVMDCENNMIGWACCGICMVAFHEQSSSLLSYHHPVNVSLSLACHPTLLHCPKIACIQSILVADANFLDTDPVLHLEHPQG